MSMTNDNCRVHPERKAEVWVYGAGTQLCQFCYDAFKRVCPNNTIQNYGNVVLGWIQEQTAILCPGCAQEQAIFEDAERELDTFLQTAS